MQVDPIPTAKSPGEVRCWDTQWWIALACTIGVIVAVRSVLMFRLDLAPAMDAAYYPMQARWLVEQGRLMYDDMPLIFVIDAGFGLLVEAVTGWNRPDAFMFAASVVDSVLPALMAVPLFLMARAWLPRTQASIIIACALTLGATLCAPTLRMIGDFQKNSLAMVFCAGTLWALQRALRRVECADGQSYRIRASDWWPLLALATLAVLTHVGGFGATMVAGTLSVVAWSTLRVRTLRTAMRTGAIAIFVCIALVGAIWIFRPAAIEQGVDLIKQFAGTQESMQPRPMRGPIGAPGMNGPQGMNGPPRDSSPAQWGLILGVAATSIASVLTIGRRMPSSIRATVIGASLAAIFLSMPLVPSEFRQRFSLMSPLPAAIAALGLCGAITQLRARWAPWCALLAALAISAAPLWQSIDIARNGSLTLRPVVDQEMLDEFAKVREKLDDPAHTLILADHGVQYWAGLVIGAPARNSIPTDMRERFVDGRYTRVISIDVDRRGRGAQEGFMDRPRGRTPVGPDGEPIRGTGRPDVRRARAPDDNMQPPEFAGRGQRPQDQRGGPGMRRPGGQNSGPDSGPNSGRHRRNFPGETELFQGEKIRASDQPIDSILGSL